MAKGPEGHVAQDCGQRPGICLGLRRLSRSKGYAMAASPVCARRLTATARICNLSHLLGPISPKGSILMSEHVQKQFYILNTNKANNDRHQSTMLEKHRAIAACSTKYAIERLGEGDTVFLYESGRGIIASGTVHGKLRKGSYKGVRNEEYSKGLEKFVYISPPFSAADIKETTRKNWIFRPTMFELDKPSGRRILAAVGERSSQRQL